MVSYDTGIVGHNFKSLDLQPNVSDLKPTTSCTPEPPGDLL